MLQALPYFLLTLTCLMTKVSAAAVTDTFTDEEKSDIHQFVNEVMHCANIPGLALGVIRGSATYADGLGHGELTQGLAVSSNTIFNLGSTAKALVPYVMADVLHRTKTDVSLEPIQD
ncbi:uncharacterized protein LOC131938866 [Physella acuta]|uniref:uncharacterized protein LOC131938866 n=1 Tax=Physella acuta TaxID=109671 RepID=UPI0027DC6B46|nr:uncharacterized protein LOC131938866 [Physella acuta]